MKRLTVLLFIFAFCSLGTSAQKRVIENPSFEFSNTGIRNVVKIEADAASTRVHVLNTFIPGWWVNFSNKMFLEDTATGKRYIITDMEGGQVDQRIVTPASGESSVVLIFPPLDKGVKKINFGEEDVSIYGISLEKPRGKQRSGNSGDIPESIRTWMAEEVGEYGDARMKPFDAPDFFGHGTALLAGYIKGYDARAEFATGVIHANNNFTRESMPVAFDIEPDGRFTVDIPMTHPQTISIGFARHGVPIYLEQGCRQGIILDWEDFLRADRFRNNPNYKFENTEFAGSLARLNRELHSFTAEKPVYAKREQIETANTPEGVKDFYKGVFDRNMASLDELKGSISDDAYQILRLTEYYNYGESLMAYERNHCDGLTSEFYDFLKELPLDNPGFQTTGDWVFINRFEYMRPLTFPKSVYQPEKSFYEYLEEECGIALPEEERKVIDLWDSIIVSQVDPQDPVFTQASEMVGKINTKYWEYKDGFDDKYLKPFMERIDRFWEFMSEYRDSVYNHVLKLEPSLVYDMMKVRALNDEFENVPRATAIKAARRVSDAVRHPFLKDEVWRLFEQSLPPEGGGVVGYVLAPGKGTDIFRGIVDQFKGSLVLVDFWATSCGPCVYAIEHSMDERKSFEESGRLTYVFITAESGSRKDLYDAFVEKHELRNTFRVNNDEWNHLQQLFRISGIPHYVLLDKEGRVLDDKFEVYNLEHELKKYE